MRCQFCGAEVMVGARFCMNCSAPIEYDKETQEKLEKEQLKREKGKKQKKIRRNIIKCGSTTLGLLTICLVFIGIFYDKEEKTFNTNKVEHVVNVVSEFKENQNSNLLNTEDSQLVDGTKDENRIPLNMGETLCSNSYAITLEDVDIIDKNYEKAILYNFRQGEEFVFVKVSLENLLYEDAVYSSLFHFIGLYNGVEINQSKSGTLGEGNKFISIDGLNQRRQTKSGYICYSLPEGWQKLEIRVNIDGLENEPMLIVENPKNRVLSNEELKSIIVSTDIKSCLRDEHISLSDEELYGLITDFMHLNCLSKTDYVSQDGLLSYIKLNYK